MRLGIDFGSRWIAVAIADRGNYPLVSFEGEYTGARKYFPPLVAIQRTRRIYGWDAWSAQSDSSANVLGAVEPALPLASSVSFCTSAPTIDLLTEIASALRAALQNNADLNAASAETHEVMLGIPVQVDEAQRAATIEAFRRAGFVVLGLMEEPTADSLEYRHLHPQSGSILVCHLGSRLSAASVVNIDETPPVTIVSATLDYVSADYFDAVLAELAWESAARPRSVFHSLPPDKLFSLYEECRRERESLAPSAQRFVIDLGNILNDDTFVSVSMEAIHKQWLPRLDKTIAAVERLRAAFKGAIAAIYASGEGSELPFVFRRLKEAFGEHVCRAANGRATTAIGLAIAAEHIKEDEQYRQSYLRPHHMRAAEPFPISDLDPEHWLAEFIQQAITHFDASGRMITFEAVSDLLNQHRRAFVDDMRIARKMVRTYPQLFKKT
jgi:molecular chaperone DnaK (HSP70)